MEISVSVAFVGLPEGDWVEKEVGR